MKVSKGSLKKYFIFFGITFAICFGIGAFRGAFPNEWRTFFGKNASNIYFIASDRKLIPIQTLIDFEKTHGLRVEFQAIDSFHLFQSEVHKADLLLAPLAWVPESSTSNATLPQIADLQNLLDEDFRSLKLRPEIFLPLFWSVHANQELKLWGLYTLKETALHPDVRLLIQYLLQDPERMAGWVLRTGSPSTLESMNSRNDLSMELKPIHLRNFQMQSLKVSSDK